MNRHVLGTAALVLAAAASPAWGQGGGTLSAGILGGATNSELNGGIVNTDHRWGGTAGAFLAYNNWYSVWGLEANWSQKGGEGTRIDYLEFPLTVGGGISTSQGGLKFRLYTGIGFAAKLSCTSEAQLLNCDDVRSTEWSWPIGIEVGKWTSGGKLIGLDVRYNYGLSDAFTNVGNLSVNRTWYFRLLLGTRLLQHN
jgi:hypothetical protein